jgi:hypothetical protein
LSPALGLFDLTPDRGQFAVHGQHVLGLGRLLQDRPELRFGRFEVLDSGAEVREFGRYVLTGHLVVADFNGHLARPFKGGIQFVSRHFDDDGRLRLRPLSVFGCVRRLNETLEFGCHSPNLVQAGQSVLDDQGEVRGADHQPVGDIGLPGLRLRIGSGAAGLGRSNRC